MSNRVSTKSQAPLITEADFDRLSHLAESPRYRSSQGMLVMNLKEDLLRRKVVPTTKVPKGVVTMHSQVIVRSPKDMEEETYTLVYPDESDIASGKLSVLAPMGVALLGAREGQSVEFKTPGGVRRLEVVKVVYQPETAGDFHL